MKMFVFWFKFHWKWCQGRVNNGNLIFLRIYALIGPGELFLKTEYIAKEVE